MKPQYADRAFRRRHGISQSALAQGTGLRAGTLADLEQGKHAPHPAPLGRIISFFRARGIPCDVGDLLVYSESSALGAEPAAPPEQPAD